MNNLLRLSCIRALLPGLVLVAVPAGASAQSRFMGPRMGNPGMMARPAGSAGMAMPFRGMPTSNFGAMSPGAMPGMAPAMRSLSAGGGGTSAMSFGSYGMGSYNMQGYGGTGSYNMQGYGDPGVSTDRQANAAAPQPSPEDKAMSRLLTASGVPNDNGQLRWALGLAILAAPGADELREQIEALFDAAARQAAAGPVNPVLGEEAHHAVQKLRRLLLKEKAERFGMPLAVYQESERFLNKLDRAEQLLRAGLGSPSEERRVKTESSPALDSTGPGK
jgi:hypothetical protein